MKRVISVLVLSISLLSSAHGQTIKTAERTSNTIVIQTDAGAVRVKNFYKYARKEGDWFNLTPGYSEYHISYDPSSKTFELSFGMSGDSWSEFVANRVHAQNKFLELLDITNREACKLSVKVRPINRYVDFPPKFYRSDFCGSTSKEGAQLSPANPKAIGATVKRLPAENIVITKNRKGGRWWKVTLPPDGWYDTGIVVRASAVNMVSISAYPYNRSERDLRWQMKINNRIFDVELDGSGFPTNSANFSPQYDNPSERVYKVSSQFRDTLLLRSNMRSPIALEVHLSF